MNENLNQNQNITPTESANQNSTQNEIPNQTVKPSESVSQTLPKNDNPNKNIKTILIISLVTILLITAVFIITKLINKEPTMFEVIFEDGYGKILEIKEVEEGNFVEKPTNPVMKGYNFIEWKYKNKTFDFNTKITENITLKASWKKETNEEKESTVIIEFNTDGGNKIASQKIKKNEKLEKPEDPQKEGYIFKGWFLEDSEYDFEKEVTEDIKLVAKWEKEPERIPTNNNQTNNNQQQEQKPEDNKPITPEPTKKYTITFNSNGGSKVDSQTIEHGKTATKPTPPTRTGYTFKGWYLEEVDYNFNKKVTKDITLVAKWEKKPLGTYTVTFNTDGGSSIQSATVTEGNKVSQPSNPTKDGYNFAGWTLNGTTYDFNNSVTGNITLLAKWSKKIYTIKASAVDSYSPDRILTIYEDGTQITVQSILYDDGVTELCSGSNTTVNSGDIEGMSNWIVILNNGTKVNATLN